MDTDDSSRGVPAFLTGATSDIQLGPDLDLPASQLLQLDGTKPGHNGAPLGHRSSAYPERLGDIRGFLKVIQNVLFEHDSKLTTVNRKLQPDSTGKLLTLVAMREPKDLAERLKKAMKDKGLKPSELAGLIGVSKAAMSKLVNGETKEMKAGNLAEAAKHLGVTQEWLRTGFGEAESKDRAASDALQVEKILNILDDLSDPITQLASAISELRKTRTKEKRG